MMGENAEEPPPGLQITEGGDGRWTARYRPGGIGWLAMATFAPLLLASTTALLIAVGVAVFGPGGVVAYIDLALVGLGLVVQVLVFGFVLWTVGSVTAFTFRSDELVVVRSLLGYRRRRVFRQGEVRSVAQVQEGESSSWTLEVASNSRVKLLPWQPIDSSRWLGSRIAQWAGVPLETRMREKPEPFESL
jgi:hypothetical protein